MTTEQTPDLPAEIRFFKERDLRWLWRYLYKEAGNRIGPEDHVEPSRRRGALATYLRERTDRDRLIQQIMAAHKNAVVPDEHLRWLDPGDQRLLIWMLFAVQRPYRIENQYRMDADYGPNAVPPPPPPLEPFLRPGIRSPSLVSSAERLSEITLALDTWQDLMDYKLNFIRHCQGEWEIARTPARQIKWLKDDKNQVEWAWNYLQERTVRPTPIPRNAYALTPPYPEPSPFPAAVDIPPPITHTERRAAVLASLDRMIWIGESERRHFIDKMKKTWSQKKYRDSGKDKKPYHLKLTKSARSKLDWLATHFEMKPTDVLESLIQQKHETESALESESPRQV